MLRVYGEHEDRTIAQMQRCMAIGSARAGVLCADGHLGYAHPIGGVVAYADHISISGVGFDIACGNLAARLDVRADALGGDRLREIGRQIVERVSFGLGRKNDTRVEHELFDRDELWKAAGVKDIKQKAVDQLGTVGSGNHYVDLLEDEAGQLWIGVHFGSRGLGHTITTRALKAVDAKDGMEVEPALVEAESDIGRQYMAGLELGGLYAYAGREWVVEQVAEIVGAEIMDAVHNHHNWMWRETHAIDGKPVELYVVRKGATPAFPGQRGFVGGSMGDDAVILEGLDGEAARACLYSTVHGAGRVIGRRDAIGRHRKDPETGRKIREPGRVRHYEWQRWVAEKGVILLGGGLDEAPQCYRRLPDVLAYHEASVRIVHTLRPRVVIMAGANEVDPYKD